MRAVLVRLCSVIHEQCEDQPQRAERILRAITSELTAA